MRRLPGRLLLGLLALGVSGAATSAPPPRLPASPPPAIAAVRIGPIGPSQVGLALILAPKAIGPCEGRVRGTLTFFGASSGALVSGTLGRGAAGCELPVSFSYDAFPADALGGARVDALDLRFRGEQAGEGAAKPVDWSGTVPRAAIRLTESIKVTLRRFVRVPDLHLGRVGLSRTTVKADVGVMVPLRFDLRVVEARCDVEVNGKRVASGGREKFILHAARENRLEIPITVDNGALVTATGKTVLKGGKVQGRLSGHARVRLPGGEVDFPFEFPVQLKLL